MGQRPRLLTRALSGRQKPTVRSHPATLGRVFPEPVSPRPSSRLQKVSTVGRNTGQVLEHPLRLRLLYDLGQFLQGNPPQLAEATELS